VVLIALILVFAGADPNNQLEHLKNKFLESYRHSADRVQSETSQLARSAQLRARGGIHETSLIQLEVLRKKLSKIAAKSEDEAAQAASEMDNIDANSLMEVLAQQGMSSQSFASAEADMSGGVQASSTASSAATAGQKTAGSSVLATKAWLSDPSRYAIARMVADPHRELVNDLTVVPVDAAHETNADILRHMSARIAAQPALIDTHTSIPATIESSRRRSGPDFRMPRVVYMDTEFATEDHDTVNILRKYGSRSNGPTALPAVPHVGAIDSQISSILHGDVILESDAAM